MLKKLFRRRALIEELEPRILFSADLAPFALDGLSPAPEQRVLTADGEYANLAATTRNELVIVDTGVQDYETLLADMLDQAGSDRHFSVVVLDANRDGIEQISDVLKQYGNLDAVHLISHGGPGSLQLGNSQLDAASLDSRAAEIVAWGAAFNEDADWLIYGCDVAAGAEGEAFVRQLGALTQTDVAGSDDLTGSAVLGGDWVLEYATGRIESEIAMIGLDNGQWLGVLETLVNQSASGDQKNPAMATSPTTGTSVVVWSSDQGDGSQTSVWGRLLDATGNPVGNDFLVNTYTPGRQETPAVGMDALGNFVVVWASNGQDGSLWGIYGQRFNADGTRAGVEFRVNSTTPGNQEAPAIAVAADGTFVVAWRSDQTNSGDIYASVFADDGSELKAEFRVNSNWFDGSQDAPSVAIDDNRNFAVTWQSATGGNVPGSGLDIIARPYVYLLGSWVSIVSEFTVNQDGLSGGQTLPSIAMTWDTTKSAGWAVVSWTGQDSSNTGVYAQNFYYDYSLPGVWFLGSNYRANSTEIGDQTNSTVAMDGVGNFLVAWDSFGQDGGGLGVYAQHYRFNNTTLTITASASEFLVNTTTALDQMLPVASLLDNGNALFVWSGNGVGDDPGIFVQRYALNNAAPVITTTGTALNYTENDPATVVDSGLIISDTVPGTLTVATVSLTGNYISGQDVLAFTDQLGISGSWNAGTGVLTLTGTASVANYQTALRTVTYYNSSNNPSTLARTVSFVVNDGTSPSVAATLTVNVAAVNDAPQATNLSAAEGYAKNTALNLADIVVSDPDSADVTVTLTLSNPAAGSLNTGTSGGVTSAYNAGTGVWSASGAIADVNTLLAGLTFTPTANFNTSFSIATSVSDGVAAPITGTKVMTAITAVTQSGVSSAASAGAVSSLSFSHTVNAGNDRLLIVEVVIGDSSYASSVTYNGTPLTLLATMYAQANEVGVELWYMVAPPVGTGTVDITIVPTWGPQKVVAGAATFYGVDQTTPLGTPATGKSNNSEALLTLPSVSGDMVVDVVGALGVSSSTVGAGQTPLFTQTNGSAATDVWGVSSIEPGAAAVVMSESFTGSSGRWAAIAVTVKQVGSAANVAPQATNLSAAETYTEDTQLALTPIVISDVDSSNATATLTLSNAGAGSLNTGTSGGVTSTYDTGAGEWSASGAIADVNALLAGLTFTPTLNYNSNFSIATSVSDGAATPVTGSKAFTGIAVNDAPVGTDGAVSVDEDGTYTFLTSDFGFADPFDTPANTLLNVMISTLPAAGSLTLNGTAVTAGQFVSAANINSGLLRFTPAPDANGTGYASFTFQVQDNGGTANGGVDLDPTPRTMTINVSSVNDAPTITGVTASTNINDTGTATPFSGVVIGDVDSPAQTQTVSITLDLAAKGSLSNLGGGSYDAGTGVYSFSGTAAAATTAVQGLVFTPTANRVTPGSSETTTFTISVNDGVAPAVTDSTTTVVSTSINDAPVALDDSAVTDEDTPVTINVVANDTDAEGSVLTVSAATDGTNGTVSIAGGSVTYTPNAHFNGSDSFTYTATDGNGGTDTATVTITVNPVNDAPVMNSASLTLNEGQTVTLSAANFGITDPDDTVFTYTVSAVTGGYFQLSSSAGASINSFTSADLTANLVQFVDDDNEVAPSFSVTVSDGDVDSNTLAATVSYTPVNDAPVALDDSAVTDEDTPVTINVVANDTDAEGSVLTVSAVTQGANGTVSFAGGSVTYTPNAHFNGSDSFTYTATDGALTSGVVTVSLTVTPINDAPTASGSAFLAAIQEDDAAAPGATVADLFAANFSNPEDAGAPSHNQFAGIAVRGQSVNPAQGRWQYSTDNGASWNNFGVLSDATAVSLGLSDKLRFLPAADYAGTPNTLSVRLLDNSLTVVSGGPIDVSVNGGITAISSGLVPLSTAVTPVNDAPVASDTSINLAEDAVYSGTLPPAADAEGDTLSYTLVSQATNGTVAVNADGSFTYTPAANFHGSDSFTYTAHDGLLGSNVATVSITVSPVNDAPAFSSSASFSAPEHSPAGTTVTATDIDGDTLTYAISGGADAALFSIDAATGALILLSVPNYAAPLDANRDNIYEVTITVSDGQGGSANLGMFLVVTDVIEPVAPTPPAAPAPPPADVEPEPPEETPEPVAPVTASPAPPPAAVNTLDPAIETFAALAPQDAGFAPEATRTAPQFNDLVRKGEAIAIPLLELMQQTLKGLASDVRALEMLQVSLSNTGFQQQLDQLHDDIRHQLALDKNMVASTLAVSTGLSVGYVLWLVRGGVLLSSLLTSLPAWRLIDPLPILGHLGRHKDDAHDDDSLENMLKKSNAQPTPPAPDETTP